MMSTLHFYFTRNGLYLCTALISLVIAIANPKLDLPSDIHNYMFVLDITQSMNVSDMPLGGLSVSRLDYTRHLISGSLKELPCGSKVSIALFANSEVVPLFVPIEVCANYEVLQDSLEHIEWRMSWRGSSHLRLGLQDIEKLMLTLPEPAQIIFFTDGDEAAPINAITKIELTRMQGSNGWLLVGIGSQRPSPVPKFNSKNEIIGYWSAYATKIEPSQIVNEDSAGKRDDSIASDPHEYYLSAMRESYLKELAHDIGASYIRGDSQKKLISAIRKLPPAWHSNAPVNMGWIFAVFAGLMMIMDYMPAKRKVIL